MALEFSILRVYLNRQIVNVYAAVYLYERNYRNGISIEICFAC